MFTRRKPPAPPARAPRSVGLTVPVIGLAAAPDYANLARVGTLNKTLGAAMQGRAGGIRGYDRGDPAHSFTGPVQGAPSITVGINRVTTSTASTFKPPATFQDSALGTGALDPLDQAFLARSQP